MTQPPAGYRGCGSAAHQIARRQFLGGLAGSGFAATAAGTWSDLVAADKAASVARGKRHCILLWMAGGMSQFETLDPKPGRPTGGPFRSIATKVPGVRISELMPLTAQIMDKFGVVRSLNSGNGDHNSATYMMHTGYAQNVFLDFPSLGAVVAHELGLRDTKVPNYVNIDVIGEGNYWDALTPAFLGADYGPFTLPDGNRPPHLHRLEALSALDHADREAFRAAVSDRFARQRRAADATTYNAAFQRVRGLMASDELLDVTKESQADRDHYGPSEFQQHCLLARRLVEAGVSFVKIRRPWWDTHSENFDCHKELVADLDRGYSALLTDLERRGLLESTLVLIMSEFGRTPQINDNNGRDHFASAWSVAFAGCGVKGGVVHGESDANGNTVAKDEVKPNQVFATIYRAIGLNPKMEYHTNGRPVTLTDKGEPIPSLLS